MQLDDLVDMQNSADSYSYIPFIQTQFMSKKYISSPFELFDINFVKCLFK